MHGICHVSARSTPCHITIQSKVSVPPRKRLYTPHIITLVLNQQKKHPTRRREKQICQHSFIIHPDRQAGLKSPHIPSSTLHVVSESCVSEPAGRDGTRGRKVARRCDAGDRGRSARRADVGGGLGARQRWRERPLNLGRLVLVGSEVHCA